MKIAMKIFSLLAAAAALILCACDRHEWEGEKGTKRLYEHHEEGHGDGHGDEHGKSHEKGHAKEEAHGADGHKEEEAPH